jgi:hypothetical protein
MAVRRGVDEVLEGAVERGDVPLVVAMAADEDGVIYEGAFGERTPGSGEAVTRRSRRSSRSSAATWTSTTPSRPTCPSSRS